MDRFLHRTGSGFTEDHSDRRTRNIFINLTNNEQGNGRDWWYSVMDGSGYGGDIGRLVDDHQISGYHGKLKEIENQNKSLFKYQGEEPIDPFTIPDKCPLEKI